MIAKIAAPIAEWIANYSARPEATLYAILTVLAWLAAGPITGYSGVWLSFGGAFFGLGPYVGFFALEYTANRNATAVNVKLDAHTIAIPEADNRFVGIEKLPDGKVDELRAEVCSIEPTALETVSGKAGMA